MPALPRQFLDALRERKLLPQQARILVAVSGGVDSMVLLHLLAELAPRHRWQLTVAHFNHRLRGRSSDADERLVRQTARGLGLRCCCGRGQVRELARRERLSLEMAARALRHRFLARSARRCECSHVALAHHADDQVELFFLRLLRGASGEGLAGMAWSGPSPADGGVTLVRPLLATPKAALTAFAEAREILFREDFTNQHESILRNRIRHRLLPLVREEFQPALAEVVLRVMETLAGEAEVVGEAASRWLKARRPAFARLPAAVQRQCLAAELRRLGCEPDFGVIEQLRLRPQQPVMVRPGLCVVGQSNSAPPSQRELLTLVPASTPPEAVAAVSPSRLAVPLATRRGATRLAFGGITLNLRCAAGCTLPPRRDGTEFFDAQAVGPRITLRHWQAGDRFQPLGLPAAAKLQDLFTNAKVPRAERLRRVVAEAADGRIFWVEGLRIGDAFKVLPTTQRRLCWSWRR